MKSMILALTCMLLISGCGKSADMAPDSKPTNPVIPNPTPPVNHLVGVYKGQDYFAGFQDVLTLNADGTGTQLSCNWTFNWVDDYMHPGNISITNVVSPNRSGGICDPGVFAGPRLLPYTWIINYTAVSIGLFIGNTFTYFKQ